MSEKLMKVLGDHQVSGFLKDVKGAEILDSSYRFVHTSTTSTLALELDPRGPETTTIVCCMSSIFDSYMVGETISSGAFDRLRMILAEVHRLVERHVVNFYWQA